VEDRVSRVTGRGKQGGGGEVRDRMDEKGQKK
jgi:hypothetical protein